MYAKLRARPGFEPGTSRTLSENHTPRPTSQSIQIQVVCVCDGAPTAPPRTSHTSQTIRSKSETQDSRDRLVVRTLRCGRSNPGSNPGHGMLEHFLHVEARYKNDRVFLTPALNQYKLIHTGLAFPPKIRSTIKTFSSASAGNRTRINCLEGSYADHYTTDATVPARDYFDWAIHHITGATGTQTHI